jgi:hypothetical protein
VEADGALAALRLLDAHPEIALLFTDIVMPDINGRKFAEEALRRRIDRQALDRRSSCREAACDCGQCRVDEIGRAQVYRRGFVALRQTAVIRRLFETCDSNVAA